MSRVRELLDLLHYHQGMVRLDLRCARRGMQRCREIGAELRRLRGYDRQGGAVVLIDKRPAGFDPNGFVQTTLFEESHE